MIHIQAADGADLLTVEPAKAYGSVVLSAPTLTSGLSCSVDTGGSSTGAADDGLCSGGACSGGTLETTLNLNSIVTSVSFN